MNPQRLVLKNFLSYADETVDLSGIKVAAILGQNGHGKSSFLEAMAFAMFGKGRYSTLDEYIRDSATSMSVEFEFLLGADRYRIIRGRSTEKGGKTTLEFHVRNSDKWAAISGKDPRETQAKIEETLHLTYDIYTSSSYIIQGAADRFTRATPADRKRILIDILALDYFIPREKIAKERAAEAGKAAAALQVQILRDEQELQNESALRTKRDGFDLDLARARGSIALIEADLASNRDGLQEINNQIAALREKNRTLEAAKNAQGAIHEQIAEVERKLATTQKILDNRELIEQRAAELAEINAEIERLNAAEQERLTEAAERQRLEAELAKASNEASRLKTKVEADLQQLKNNLSILQMSLATLKGNAEAAVTAAQTKLDDLRRRAGLLEKVKCDRSDCRFLQDALAAREAIPAAEEALTTAEWELAQEIYIPAETLQRRATMQAEIGRLEELFATGQYQPAALIAKINNLQAQIAAMPEPVPSHKTRIDDLQAQASGLRQYADLKARLAAAEATAGALTEQIADLRRQYDAKEEEIQALVVELLELPKCQQRAQALTADISEAERSLNEKRETVARLTRELGSIDEALARCEAARQRLETQRAEKDRLEREAAQWGVLATAYGKTGIPIMITENAIPELEARANDILTRMTSGRMRLELRTQVANKSGDGVREVLDIMVWAGNAVRKYEGCSGGEQFRIDFSLRVALAMLMARRAGARVETLIIDEGIGSQDAEGRQLFLEAIGAVSQWFAKVLIVTHIEEIQTLIGSIIRVTKDQAGSHVRIAA